MRHPKTADEITRDWIGFVLREAGVCSEGQVKGISVEPLGSEVSGFLSYICRVRVSYENRERTMPDSLVIKFPPEDRFNREFAQGFRANERELLFYRYVAPSSPIRIPRCYYTVLEEEIGNYVLVLEDEKDWKTGNQVEGLTRVETETAVKAIAKFHARWWESPELRDFDWMPASNRDIKYAFKENWQEFKKEHSDVLTKKDIHAGDMIAKSGGKIEELIKTAPITITHTDFRADNLMFKGEEEVLVLDWQVSCKLGGAYDVARVVSASLRDEISYEDHLGFTDLWYEGLVSGGVEDYTIAEAFRDYRSALLFHSYVPVTAHHLISHEGSRGVPLLKAMITRVFRAIHDCRALDLIK